MMTAAIREAISVADLNFRNRTLYHGDKPRLPARDGLGDR